MPRVSAEQRQVRDALVVRSFLAGTPLRTIGKHPKVNLSCRGVELAIRQQLSASSPQVLAEHAHEVHVMRWQELWKAAYARAVAGDLHAIETCRRLLLQQGRLFGLYGENVAGMTPMDRYARRYGE